MLVKCLYCDAVNDATVTGSYCENCGKKLPPAATLRPRRTLGGDVSIEDEPAPRQKSLTGEALVVAAVVYLVAGGLFLILGPMFFDKVPERFAPDVLSWTVLPTLALGALAWLARTQAQAAALGALGLGAAWVALTFLLNPKLAQGWVIVDVALFVFLLRAAWLSLRPAGRGTAG
jgi:hypothetical protein